MLSVCVSLLTFLLIFFFFFFFNDTATTEIYTLSLHDALPISRATLQDELMRIVEKTGATALMVTHDVDEAVVLSDRVVMMTNGPAARIGEVLQVTLPRPRERLALAHDARFMDLRAPVLEFLYDKQARKARLKVA